jgi:hypothetical protein
MLRHSNPEVAAELLAIAQKEVGERWKRYEALAQNSAAAAIEDTAALAAKGGK